MKHWALLITLLAVTVWAAAQTTSSGGSAAGTQAMGGNVTAGDAGSQDVLPNTGQVATGATSTSGLNTSTGTAVVTGPASPPLLVTPLVHLSSTAPNVGATNATPGNTAGAMNSTFSIPQNPTVITTVPEVSMAPAAVMMAPAPQQTGAATVTPGVATVRLFDRGVGGDGASVSADMSGKSLGELARENRQGTAAQSAHVYTNTDIQRINQQPGVTVGGMSGATVGAGSTVTSQPSSGGTPVVSEPAGTSAPPSSPGVSTPANPPEQSHVAPPASESAGTTEMAQANPPAGQEAMQAETESRGERQLPSTGSVLPLVALAGVAAAAAGLLSRKSNT